MTHETYRRQPVPLQFALQAGVRNACLLGPLLEGLGVGVLLERGAELLCGSVWCRGADNQPGVVSINAIVD